MSQENIHLENVLEKNVRAKKSLVGHVEAISDRYILVTGTTGMKYNVPRSHIKGEVGREILLDISPKDLQKYRFK
jgi:hypothetical protein